MLGLPRDQAKANELWLKAGELGCDVAYHNLGNAYNFGSAVTIDKKKAKQYYELAAMKGSLCVQGTILVVLKVGIYERVGYKGRICTNFTCVSKAAR